MGHASVQLAWDFPHSHAQPQHTPQVWLISGTPEACETLRRRLTVSGGPNRTTCIIDVETGDAVVAAHDLIVLKERGANQAEIFAPSDLEGDAFANIAAFVSHHLKSAAKEMIEETRGLTLIRFEGWRRVSKRQGWGRSIHESTLDSLSCRVLMTRSRLVARLCSEALAAAEPSRQTVLEGLLRRVLADSLACEQDAASESQYVAAARLFRQYDLGGPARACRVRQQRQIRASQAALFTKPEVDLGVAYPGFRPVALSGLRVVLEPGPRAPVRAGLRHRRAGSLTLRNDELETLLGNVSPPTTVVSLEVEKRTEQSGRLASFAINVVADGDLATALGLAGRGSPRATTDEIAFIVHCQTCAISGSLQATILGRPARFVLSPRTTGPHDIFVSVLTGRDAPKIICFPHVTHH